MYMYVCVYVSMDVLIRCPRAQHACVCASIDTVRIISIDRVQTLNVAHQTTEARAL